MEYFNFLHKVSKRLMEVIQKFGAGFRIQKAKVLHKLRIWFKTVKMPLFFDFLRWVIIDIKRGKTKNPIYGIWLYCAYFGEGKTLSMCNRALQLKKRYPYIKLASTFNFKYADIQISHWKEIEGLPDNTVLLFDEIVSSWNNKQYNEFPFEFLSRLTQCRKKHLMVLATAPQFDDVVIQFRRYCDFVIECKNILGLDRLFKNVYFRRDKYEKYKEANEEKLKKAVYFKTYFVADDAMYDMYNTHEIVSSIAKNQLPVKSNTLIIQAAAGAEKKSITKY